MLLYRILCVLVESPVTEDTTRLVRLLESFDVLLAKLYIYSGNEVLEVLQARRTDHRSRDTFYYADSQGPMGLGLSIPYLQCGKPTP